MAVAFVNVGTRASSAGATSRNPALPASLVNGNILICEVYSKNAATHSISGAGWAAVHAQQGITGSPGNTISRWWRVVDGTETAPTVSWTGSAACFAQIYQYSGTDTTAPFGAISHSSAFGGATHTSTSINTTAANSLVVYMDVCGVNTALGTPAGWTENYDVAGATGSTRNAGGSKTVASSGGASGAISVTGGNNSWQQSQIELLEATGGGSPTTVTVSPATLSLAAQPVTTNAKRLSSITAATLSLTAQSLTTNAKRVSSIALATITAAGQALSTKVSARSQVLAGTITATAQSMTTRVAADTIIAVVAATITATAQALATRVNYTVSVTNATIRALGKPVTTFGSALPAAASNLMALLHDITNRLLDVVMLGSSNNDTASGYYEELARACEALAGTSPSPLANPIDDGYLWRAAVALEAIASTDGSTENPNYEGLLKRVVDAIEDYTGTSSEGSLLHRLQTAVYQL